MKISCIIPARGGSKSIPKKNIIKLGEFPLIAYSIAIAKMSRYIEDVVVSTDSEEIRNIAKHYGASVPYTRPDNISTDNSIDIDFFNFHYEFLKKEKKRMPELVVHLRPTTPLRCISVVDSAIEYMINDSLSTSLRSMHETHLTPYKMFKEVNGFALPFQNNKKQEFYNLPRQSFETAFIPNGYVDIVRPSVLVDTGMLHGDKMKIWNTKKIADIDVWDDVDYANDLLTKEQFLPLLNYLKCYV